MLLIYSTLTGLITNLHIQNFRPFVKSTLLQEALDSKTRNLYQLLAALFCHKCMRNLTVLTTILSRSDWSEDLLPDLRNLTFIKFTPDKKWTRTSSMLITLSPLICFSVSVVIKQVFTLSTRIKL